MPENIKAKLSFMRISPQKARLVVNEIRGKRVGEAIDSLSFTMKKAAPQLVKIVKSAMANAQVKGNVNLDSLVVKEAFVGPGPTMKRFLPRAMGRATKIRKRTSHITVILEEK